jgi:hypothetical protein
MKYIELPKAGERVTIGELTGTVRDSFWDPDWTADLWLSLNEKILEGRFISDEELNLFDMLSKYLNLSASFISWMGSQQSKERR